MISLAGAGILTALAVLAGPLGPVRQHPPAIADGQLTGPGVVTPTIPTELPAPVTNPAGFDSVSVTSGDAPAGIAPGRLLDQVPARAGNGLLRIRYSSVGAAGRPLAVTGLVAVPDGPAPAAGWPILSVGHPSVGSADICAPSLAPGGFAAAAQVFTRFGYLVVMSDYEGLGTTGPHPFLDRSSAGRAVLDAARAARQLAVPTTDEVVLWGISEGGEAVLAAAELAPTWAPELELRATVALAPASGGLELFQHVAASDQRVFALLAVAGLSVADGLDPAVVLTPAALPLLDRVEQECVDDLENLAAAISGDLVDLEALGSNAWRAAVDAQELGTVVISSPLLIVHGTADTLIPISYSEALVERYRALGTTVDFVPQPGAGHADVALSSLTTVVDWLATH